MHVSHEPFLAVPSFLGFLGELHESNGKPKTGTVSFLTAVSDLLLFRSDFCVGGLTKTGKRSFEPFGGLSGGDRVGSVFENGLGLCIFKSDKLEDFRRRVFFVLVSVLGSLSKSLVYLGSVIPGSASGELFTTLFNSMFSFTSLSFFRHAFPLSTRTG